MLGFAGIARLYTDSVLTSILCHLVYNAYVLIDATRAANRQHRVQIAGSAGVLAWAWW